MVGGGQKPSFSDWSKSQITCNMHGCYRHYSIPVSFHGKRYDCLMSPHLMVVSYFWGVSKPILLLSFFSKLVKCIFQWRSLCRGQSQVLNWVNRNYFLPTYRLIQKLRCFVIFKWWLNLRNFSRTSKPKM